MRKTIYKIDSEGRERMVRISTQGAEVIMESGLLAGNLVENRYACTGKNVGRANETTPEQQAELEAESRIAAKLKEEYFETIEEARSQSRQVLLPMLAKDYKKEFKKVKFPCFVQPKLDGMRCLATSSTMTSRQNTPIDTMSHIQTALRLAGIGEVLDGELYAHGLSFQENMKLIKKQRVESTMVTYHVYDLVSDEPFEKRYAKLARLVEGVRNVELVPTFVINNEEDLKRYHAKFLGEGYEGTIVRWGTQGYEVNKRSSGLLKYKDFLDVACEVIDVVPSERRPEQGVVVCRFENGNTFQCGMKFPHAEREEILRNKADYIGRTAELRFFEYTDDGMPRFPVCVGFRLDKQHDLDMEELKICPWERGVKPDFVNEEGFEWYRNNSVTDYANAPSGDNPGLGAVCFTVVKDGRPLAYMLIHPDDGVLAEENTLEGMGAKIDVLKITRNPFFV